MPRELKTVRWLDIFAIIFGFALNPGSILVGGLAVVSGCRSGARSEPSPEGCRWRRRLYDHGHGRASFSGCRDRFRPAWPYGMRGAKWVPSFLRTLASTYWFAFQTVAGSLAVVAILDRWTGTRHSLVAVSLTFAVLQAIVAIIGYDSLKHLSRMALPFKIAILSFVLVLLATHSDPHFAPAQVFHYAGKPEAGWLLFVTWLNVVAAGSLTMVTDLGRFLPLYPLAHATCGGAPCSGKVGGGFFAALLGAYGAAATLGQDPNSSPSSPGSASAISPCCCS